MPAMIVSSTAVTSASSASQLRCFVPLIALPHLTLTHTAVTSASSASQLCCFVPLIALPHLPSHIATASTVSQFWQMTLDEEAIAPLVEWYTALDDKATWLVGEERQRVLQAMKATGHFKDKSTKQLGRILENQLAKLRGVVVKEGVYRGAKKRKLGEPSSTCVEETHARNAIKNPIYNPIYGL